MVVAGKIFKLRESLGLDKIAIKLKDFRKEEMFEQEPHRFELVTEIQNLTLRRGMLHGSFIQDKVIGIRQRDEIVPTLMTKETPFLFSTYKNRVLLLIIEKKLEANRIANQLSAILFISSGQIVEVRILQEVMKHFHEENPEGTKLIWFDDVDIPNISKLSLCGPSLADTALYADYTSHGKIWYIVMTSKKYGTIVGLTRDGIVAVFGKISEPDFVSYVAEEIFPLVE